MTKIQKPRQTWFTNEKGLLEYVEGNRPHTVTIYERVQGGMFYARAWDPNATRGAARGDYRCESLGHRDRKYAEKYARAAVATLVKGAIPIERKIGLADVFAQYVQRRTPDKVRSEQQADNRRVEMWLRFLGNADPHAITETKWNDFIKDRTSGAINARGERVEATLRRPVRSRTVEDDLEFLREVLNWATMRHLENGQYLMQSNPVRGYNLPHEKNPLQPIASQDRYEALRAVSDSVLMETRDSKKGKRVMVRSYLSEILDIANGTGRRISAICKLRFQDLQLERTSAAPHGAITWPASTDKMRCETTAPLTPTVRAAIDRILAERPGIGQVPLFPSAQGSMTSITKDKASCWLAKAEKLAGLPKLKGGAWHPFRRAWATARKHLPRADVAAAGGWSSEATLERYQKADATTMLRVVMSGVELREVKNG